MPKHRFFVMIAILATFGLVVGACGSSGEDSGVASLETEGEQAAGGDSASDTSEMSQEEAILELTACLRDRGHDVPDPRFDEDGNPEFQNAEEGLELFRDPDFRDDFQACQSEIGFQFGPGQSDDPREQAEIQDQQEAMASCLRDKGFDVPTVTDGPPDPGQIAELFAHPGFEEAATDCAQQEGFELGPGAPSGGQD